MTYKENKGLLFTFMLAVLSGLLVTVIVSGVSAAMIYSERVDENASGVLAMAATLAGAVVTAYVTVRRYRERHLIMCAIAAVLYLLALMMIAAVAFSGVKEGIGVTALLVFCGGLSVFLLGLRGRKPTKYMPKKTRH